LEIDKIIFTYKIHQIESIINEVKIDTPIPKKISPNFGGYSLPKSMDISH
jgi:hypothetical protein